MARYNFKFGDYWISELGAISTETPGIEIAQRDYELIDIPGKDGADYIDNGRFENVEFSRSISLIGRKDFPVQEKAANLINTYAYLQGYHPFEDTDHNDMVTEAVLTNFNEINRKLRTLNTATLKFSRKPYWYLKSGLEYREIDLSPSVPTLYFDNPFLADSKPLIIFEVNAGTPASFQYRVTTADGEKDYNCINISANATLTINCEKGTAVINSSIYAPFDVPDGFGVGRSSFRILSGKNRISSVRIAPRWRCL